MHLLMLGIYLIIYYTAILIFCFHFIYEQLFSHIFLYTLHFFRLSLVESIPENLTYTAGSPSNPSIYATWLQLLQRANESIDIASSYWSLRNQDTKTYEPSAYQVIPICFIKL